MKICVQAWREIIRTLERFGDTYFPRVKLDSRLFWSGVCIVSDIISFCIVGLWRGRLSTGGETRTCINNTDTCDQNFRQFSDISCALLCIIGRSRNERRLLGLINQQVIMTLLASNSRVRSDERSEDRPTSGRPISPGAPIKSKSYIIHRVATFASGSSMGSNSSWMLLTRNL